MLTSRNHLLVLHMFGNSFQNYLLHFLSRDWGEAGQSGVPQVLLLALLEENSGISFLPVLWKLCQSPWPFKDDQWPFTDVCHLRQNSWVPPIGSQRPSVYTVCLNVPWPQPPPPRLSFASDFPPSLKSLGFLKSDLTSKDQGGKALSIPAFFMSFLTSSLHRFSTWPTFALAILLLLTRLKKPFLLPYSSLARCNSR